MSSVPAIPVKEFTYDLPEGRIANYPVHPHHNSNLLLFENGNISDHKFNELQNLLPPDTLLVLNNTKVIPARLIFQLESGGHVEVFLLKALNASKTDWECQVGHRKKFREGMQLWAEKEVDGKLLKLGVQWLNRESNTITLLNDNHVEIHELLDHFGRVPLPPYIKRSVIEEDKKDYQTIFAKEEGAVAAPTASLHFTAEVMQSLENEGIQLAELTLHVGLGTFKPVTAETADAHTMHSENFCIEFLELKKIIENRKKRVVAAGTTSMRVLESLYYIGAGLLTGAVNPMEVPSDAGYRAEWKKLDEEEVWARLMAFARQNGTLTGSTSIFILPGFRFRICRGLITNFHQPGSTLLMLVAAFAGEKWKQIYDHALGADYRFLSYGDASLLWGLL